MIFLRWIWWYTKPCLQERNSHVWFCSPTDKRVCWEAIHDLGSLFPTIVFMHLVLNSVCCWKTNFSQMFFTYIWATLCFWTWRVSGFFFSFFFFSSVSLFYFCFSVENHVFPRVWFAAHQFVWKDTSDLQKNWINFKMQEFNLLYIKEHHNQYIAAHFLHLDKWH